MGLFISIAGVIGRDQASVANALHDFLLRVEGGLEKCELDYEHTNCCVIEEENGNTSVCFPADFSEWGEASEFLSRELKAPVFSLHIHDGSLWMYELFVNGEVADRFNPVPDYWEEINEEEANEWKGDPEVIVKILPGVRKDEIENYFVRWDLNKPGKKAYTTDEFPASDWQLLDFMKKIGLTYPLDREGVTGQSFKFWSKHLPLNNNNPDDPDKPWWKMW